ncbi:hypothetical protein, partial [Roseiconus lacunae]
IDRHDRVLGSFGDSAAIKKWAYRITNYYYRLLGEGNVYQTATSDAINRRLMFRCQSTGAYVSHPARRK